MFKRSGEQHAELDQLLERQQDPFSPDYHRWLTPEEFANRFGVDGNIRNRVENWLKTQGFTVESTARGGGWIVFSGTAGQIQKTFQTEIHRYQYGDRTHFAAASAPAIPAEFESVIGGIRGLDDFFLEPPSRLTPEFTGAKGFHALAPGDIDSIYDLFLYYTFPSKALGIAVVGQSAIDLADIRQFRSTFQLPPNDPTVVLVGDDPGIDPTGGLLEADADIEWAGAISRISNITYVYASDVMNAAQYAIDQNIAPILSFSYGGCELDLSATDGASLRDMAQQANAQGITWVAASGDNGAANCDHDSYPATRGLSVSFPASLPEVTGVGGTEFNENGGAYWGFTNNPALSSAGGYIPEIAWNDTAPGTLLASGGGASVLYVKPPWQTGRGVPDNGARNVPDLSLTASPTHDPYLVFSNGKQYTAGGTSLPAPVFAGILALAAQGADATFSGFGNINPSLYVLAANDTYGLIFHDITSGSNMVPCMVGSADCESGLLGYRAGAGYDQVTGLGSLNAQNFVTNLRLATTITVSTPATTVTEATPVTFTIHVQEFNGRIPAGTVNLTDANSNNSRQPLGFSTTLDASGSAVITVSLIGGPHSITAAYFGAFPFMQSTSAPITMFANPLPPQPTPLNSPADKATNVSFSTNLSWGYAASFATYDVYFGSTNPPPFWGNVSGFQAYPGGLAPNTTYYWKVVAKNISGTASSPVRSFSTGPQALYLISRIAGMGVPGFSGDGGPATQAGLNQPSDLIWDTAGNLYIADTYNHRIRKMSPDGLISTIAGNGSSLFSGDGGPAIAAGIGLPAGLALDSHGNLYFSDGWNFRVRKISLDGTITTVAGTGSRGFGGDGGAAVLAQLYQPWGLAFDAADNLYIADSNVVRQITAGVISTIAGRAVPAATTNFGDGGPATSATLTNARGIAFDGGGNLYIADLGDQRIRKVSNGIISTVATAGADYIAIDPAGGLYFTDFALVNKVSSGSVVNLAGKGSSFAENGMLADAARLESPTGIRVDSSGRITLADSSGVLVLTPISGSPLPAISAGGIVNAAGFSGGPLAAGSIATAFGNFLLTQPQQATGAPAPTVLSGISLQFQASTPILAPLFYASSQQINFQIPWELAGQSSVQVVPILNGARGPSETLTLASFGPGIFTDAQGQGAVLDASYQPITSKNPATAGSVIQIFCTGLGAVTNPPATGSPASSNNLSASVENPTVTIGGMPAAVLFSGLAPGSVGEYQVNVQVPSGVPTGPAVRVIISAGGVDSNPATIAVQ